MTIVIKPSKKILDRIERLRSISESLKRPNNGNTQSVTS